MMMEKQRQYIVICRCCLSEQDENEHELDKFISLDTAAMINISENDKSFTDSTTSTYISDADDSPQKPTAEAAAATTTTLLDCLNACARISASMEDTQLPLHICLDCCQALEACCEFIRCVRNADKILRGKLIEQQQQQQLLKQHNKVEQLQLSGLNINENSMDTYSKEYPPHFENLSKKTLLSPLLLPQQPATDDIETPTHEMEIKFSNILMPHKIEASSTANNENPQTRDNKSYIAKSIDSGIDIDDDLNVTKLNNNYNKQLKKHTKFHLEQYEGFTYVVSSTIAHELQQFHQSIKTNNDNSFICGFCVFQCDAREKLNKHLETHLGRPGYKCDACDFMCRFNYVLKQHMLNVHNICEATTAVYAVVNSCINDVSMIREYTQTPSKYHCKLCNQYLINFDALQQHFQMHKEFYQCAICSLRGITREVIVEHMAKDHKLYVDQKLIAQYVPLNDLNVNAKLEAFRNVIKQLSKSSSSSKDNKHKKHLCQFCGNRFDRHFHLLKHEYRVHKMDIESLTMEALKQKILKNNSPKQAQLTYIRQRKAAQIEKHYRCIDCTHRIFKTSEDLQLHKEEHNSSKFKCHVCSAQFLFNFELKYHMRTHNNPNNCNNNNHNNSNTNNAQNDKHCIQSVNILEVLSTVKYENEKDENYYYNTLDIDMDMEIPKVLSSTSPLSSPLKPPESLGSVETDNSSLVGSLVASPISSDNAFDINLHDELYLNDFDLGLLDFL